MIRNKGWLKERKSFALTFRHEKIKRTTNFVALAD
jgi:hypothetical protein